MSKLYIPADYQPILNTKETEHAIVMIKDFFQTALATELNLRRVTAPLLLPAGTGLNDDLNGVEVPVNFNVKDMGGINLEIVQSLAKWKRVKVTELGLMPDFGIFYNKKMKNQLDILKLHSSKGRKPDKEEILQNQAVEPTESNIVTTTSDHTEDMDETPQESTELAV